jgi:hypothetical protein
LPGTAGDNCHIWTSWSTVNDILPDQYLNATTPAHFRQKLANPHQVDLTNQIYDDQF